MYNVETTELIAENFSPVIKHTITHDKHNTKPVVEVVINVEQLQDIHALYGNGDMVMDQINHCLSQIKRLIR